MWAVGQSQVSMVRGVGRRLLDESLVAVSFLRGMKSSLFVYELDNLYGFEGLFICRDYLVVLVEQWPSIGDQ